MLTPDGWYKSGDVGYLDEEGFLHIKDRSKFYVSLHKTLRAEWVGSILVKDIIIRGGENIVSLFVGHAKALRIRSYCFQDSVSIENALYSDERVLEIAAVGVPDKRLGELPVAIVTLKKGHYGTITEDELAKFSAKRFV